MKLCMCDGCCFKQPSGRVWEKLYEERGGIVHARNVGDGEGRMTGDDYRDTGTFDREAWDRLPDWPAAA